MVVNRGNEDEQQFVSWWMITVWSMSCGWGSNCFVNYGMLAELRRFLQSWWVANGFSLHWPISSHLQTKEQTICEPKKNNSLLTVHNWTGSFWPDGIFQSFFENAPFCSVPEAGTTLRMQVLWKAYFTHVLQQVKPRLYMHWSRYIFLLCYFLLHEDQESCTLHIGSIYHCWPRKLNFSYALILVKRKVNTLGL